MSIQLKVDIKDKLKGQLKSIKDKLKQLPKEAYDEFRKNTPVKTGYARKHTTLKKSTIEAKYPYAEVLDKGRHMTKRGMRGSEQAPEGMSKPTEEFIKRRVRQILQGK